MNSVGPEVAEADCAALQQALDARRYLQEWRMQVVASEPGTATVAMPAPDADRANDPAHGGIDRALMLALGDAAGWLSVIASGAGADAVATLEMKIDLVRQPADPRELVATATVIRRGNALSTVNVDVTAHSAAGPAKVAFIAATYMVG